VGDGIFFNATKNCVENQGNSVGNESHEQMKIFGFNNYLYPKR
jgi:hypothetical protein